MATRSKCVVRFQTRIEAVTCIYQGITFTGNVLDGDVHFFDVRSPKKTTIRDILFADNMCQGDVQSAPHATMASHLVMVRGNMLCKTGAYVLNADQWIWSGNTHTMGTVHVAAGAKGNIIRDSLTAAPMADSGTATHLADNLLSIPHPQASKPPP